MQEVDRDDPVSLGVQEPAPGRARAARRRIDATSSQDFIDGGLCVPKTSATWADAPTVRRRLGSVSGALLAGGGLPGRAMIFGLWA
jgi:hypothetical protein